MTLFVDVIQTLDTGWVGEGLELANIKCSNNWKTKITISVTSPTIITIGRWWWWWC